MLKYTTEQLAAFNKGQLREACRANAINYASLNNDGMRAALATVPADEAGPVSEPIPEPPGNTELGNTEAPKGEADVLDAPISSPNMVQDNGSNLAGPPMPVSPVLGEALLANGVQIATVVPRDPFVAPVAPAKGKKERAVRVPQPEQNGVKRPKSGTICAQIWDWCDAQDAAGTRPEAKALRAALPALDDTTKTVQFYRWRKFNGISGR
ncbi:MAG TPA: hypothetical protein VIY48_21470 [Candidatus Paceibacterota bacterium]